MAAVGVQAEFHYETINVESQQNNPSSLLWWMKRLIALRKRYRAFSRGSFELLRSDNDSCLLVLLEADLFGFNLVCAGNDRCEVVLSGFARQRCSGQICACIGESDFGDCYRFSLSIGDDTSKAAIG